MSVHRPIDLSAIVTALLHRQLWAARVFGNPTLGAALVYEYYTKGRFLAAKEVAELAHISEDTARRALRKLAAVGRVDERVIDRAHVYRVTPDLAARAMAKLNATVSLPD